MMLDKIRRGLCLLTAVSLLSGPALAEENGDTAAVPAPHDGYIVRVSDTARLQTAAGKSFLRSGYYSKMQKISGGLYRVADETALKQLEQSGMVESIEPDYIITLGELPDDEFLTSGEQWYYELLGLDGCLARNVTGQGVRVGFVDSGINADHEDFQGTSIVPGTNYTAAAGSAARSDTTDEYGHGTVVAGLIAAAVGNGVGIAGIAPEVELVALKAFQGSTSKLSAIIDAIYGAVDDYHCQVLNMSLGTDQNSAYLRAAIQYAYQAGVIVVAAAGNRKSTSSANREDPPYYPAAWPEAVGVGAVDKNLNTPWFSFQNDSVWIVAPGSGICGPSYQGPNQYKRNAMGTSYASPVVAAAAALALSVRPSLTPDEFSALLRDTARDLGESGYDTATGHGLLNVGLMIAALRGDVAWQAGSRAVEFNDGERVILAGYDQNGSLAYVHGAQGASALPEDVASWRLYVLDGLRLAPIREPVVLTASPWTRTDAEPAA